MEAPAVKHLTLELAERALSRLTRFGRVGDAEATPQVAARIAALADTIEVGPAANRVAFVVDTLVSLTRCGLRLEEALQEAERLSVAEA